MKSLGGGVFLKVYLICIEPTLLFSHHSLHPQGHHPRLIRQTSIPIPTMPTYTTTFQKSFFALFGLLALNVYGHGESEERVWPRNSKLAPAKRLVPVIESRATFYGGWSLAMAPCPSGLDDHNGACCPKGTFIYSVKMGGLPKGSACCPDGEYSYFIWRI